MKQGEMNPNVEGLESFSNWRINGFTNPISKCYHDKILPVTG
jgi:hypothetical protein